MKDRSVLSPLIFVVACMCCGCRRVQVCTAKGKSSMQNAFTENECQWRMGHRVPRSTQPQILVSSLRGEAQVLTLSSYTGAQIAFRG